MKKYIFIFTLLLLTACSGSAPVEIHVFSKSIPQEEINKVVRALTDQGFKVTPNNYDVPEIINTHSFDVAVTIPM